MNYLIGHSVLLRATYRLNDGTLVTPSPVTLTIESPTGQTSTPTPTLVSTGILTYELELTEAGYWKYRWVGTTTGGTAVCEGSICAVASDLVGV